MRRRRLQPRERAERRLRTGGRTRQWPLAGGGSTSRTRSPPRISARREVPAPGPRRLSPGGFTLTLDLPITAVVLRVRRVVPEQVVRRHVVDDPLHPRRQIVRCSTMAIPSVFSASVRSRRSGWSRESSSRAEVECRLVLVADRRIEHGQSAGRHRIDADVGAARLREQVAESPRVVHLRRAQELAVARRPVGGRQPSVSRDAEPAAAVDGQRLPGAGV